LSAAGPSRTVHRHHASARRTGTPTRLSYFPLARVYLAIGLSRVRTLSIPPPLSKKGPLPCMSGVQSSGQDGHDNSYQVGPRSRANLATGPLHPRRFLTIRQTRQILSLPEAAIFSPPSIKARKDAQPPYSSRPDGAHAELDRHSQGLSRMKITFAGATARRCHAPAHASTQCKVRKEESEP
jgi:hypothetical protein